jgi:hypothetical protein
MKTQINVFGCAKQDGLQRGLDEIAKKQT